MAHEIDMSNGRANMMYVGQVPWHKLGHYVGDMEVTAEETIVAAGLDWEAEGVVPQVPSLITPGAMDTIEGYQAIRRKDTGKVLSIMSDSYKFLQNKAKFKFFDEVVGSNEAKYHTAMSLDEGRRVAILAKLPKTIKIKGDGPVEEYVLLADSFDGSIAFTMMLTPVRVVCANTLNIALGKGTKVAYKLRHSLNIESRVKDAQEALGFAVQQYEKFEEAGNHLVDTKFTDGMMLKLAEKLFPAKLEEDGSLTVSPQTRGAREAVVDLFENGKGHEGIRGSAWAAINAVAEFADHDKQTRVTNGRAEGESRAISLLFAGAAKLKQKAVDETYKLLKAA